MDRAVEKWQDRMATGLTLMVVGFLLAWIPYLDIVGGVLGLIGIFLMFFGRHGFEESESGYVGPAFGLILISLLAAVGVALWFVDALLAEITVNSSTGAVTLGAGFSNVLTEYVVALVVVGLLRAIGYTILPWGFGEVRTRQLLIVAFVAQLVVSIVSLVYFLPLAHQIATRLESDPTANVTAQVDSATYVLTLLNVIPCVLYAWAYLRARTRVLEIAHPPPRAPTPGGPTYGRVA